VKLEVSAAPLDAATHATLAHYWAQLIRKALAAEDAAAETADEPAATCASSGGHHRDASDGAGAHVLEFRR
jgi:hypothetical protein